MLSHLQYRIARITGTAPPWVLLSALSVMLAVTAPSAAQVPLLTLPSQPWFSPQAAPPNIVLTLDDSDSMGRGDVGVDNFRFDFDAIANKSNLNPLYYNPATTYTPPPRASGVPYDTTFTAAHLNGFAPATGNVNLNSQYRPTKEFAPHPVEHLFMPHCDHENLTAKGTCPGVNVDRESPAKAYWWTYVPNGSECPANLPTWTEKKQIQHKSSCFQFNQPTTAAQKQNFANWYSFYRTRILATTSSIMHALYGLPSEYRVAWQGLLSCTGLNTQCTGWNSAVPPVDSSLGPFDQAKRQALWSWLEQVELTWSTPLREALIRVGEYLKTDEAYQEVPGSTSSPLLACRQNFSIMLTDGFWTGNAVSVGNIDGSAATLPDGTTYAPTVPFADQASDTLADISFRYWSTDLRPDLPDQVSRSMPFMAGPEPTTAEYWNPRNDPARWQRMNSYFVGLGLTTFLLSPTWHGSTFAGTASPLDGYNAFAAGTPWPQPATTGTAGDIAKVYDLWHAAVNGRGRFYSVDDPAGLTAALNDMRGTIMAQQASAAPAASTSLRVQTDSLIFTTSFRSGRWDGTLQAFKVQPDGTTSQQALWSTDTTFNALANGTVGSHRVFTRSAAGGLTQLTVGNLTALPTARRNELQTQAASLGASEADLVRWVLGDTSKPELRQRERLLGALINSPPLYEGSRDYGYGVTQWSDNPRIDGPVYAAYLKSKNAGPNGTPTKPTVFVGSNDGMLHAFDARNGAHRFAFLPTPSFARLGQRAHPHGDHAWTVDGQIVTHDVHNGSAWRTILVASMGAGARGLFALDVTDPDSPTLLWEWFPSDTDLGHVLGEPVIARAQDGTWVVVTGNGVGSASNKTVLYALNALNGAVLSKIQAGTPSATIADGLSPPALLYAAGKRLIHAYAGDLRGNLWRFDLSGSPSTWTTGFSGAPLFVATGPTGQRQPITAKPRVASDRLSGRIILFGTGRLLTPGDPKDHTVQSVYGIFDRVSGGTATRSELTAQTIVSDSSNARTISTNSMPSASSGWYLDLTGTPTSLGERVVSPIGYLPEASLITVSTVQPLQGDVCTSGHPYASWVMTLSPFTGKAINLFSSAGAQTSGSRIENVMTSGTPIRKGYGSIKLSFSESSGAIRQIDLSRGWNPRSGWQQVR